MFYKREALIEQQREKEQRLKREKEQERQFEWELLQKDKREAIEQQTRQAAHRNATFSINSETFKSQAAKRRQEAEQAVIIIFNF